MKKSIPVVLVALFLFNLAVDGPGAMRNPAEDVPVLDDCHEIMDRNESVSIDTSCPNEDCPDDDCQDCHCCHNHFRYLIQNNSGDWPVLSSPIKSIPFVSDFYEQPFLDQNRKPPKTA